MLRHAAGLCIACRAARSWMLLMPSCFTAPVPCSSSSTHYSSSSSSSSSLVIASSTIQELQWMRASAFTDDCDDRDGIAQQQQQHRQQQLKHNMFPNLAGTTAAYLGHASEYGAKLSGVSRQVPNTADWLTGNHRVVPLPPPGELV